MLNLRDLSNISCAMSLIYNRTSVLSGFKTTRRSPVVLDLYKIRASRFLNRFKNIPGKACVKRVHNSDAFVDVGN